MVQMEQGASTHFCDFQFVLFGGLLVHDGRLAAGDGVPRPPKSQLLSPLHIDLCQANVQMGRTHRQRHRGAGRLSVE
jgi:hypothetical protein